METKLMIDSVSGFDGVYGAFFSSRLDDTIVAKVPQDYAPDVLRRIAAQGAETLAFLQQEAPTCYEVRMDMGEISFLMYDLQDGVLIVMIYKTEIVEFLSSAVYALCKTAIHHSGKMILPNSPAITPEKEKPSPRYTDESMIGEGGTAIVYRAYDTRLKREIALKRFKEKENPETRDDYISELESASRIHHHNVVSTYDADVDDHGRFIVMEFIDGEDLEKTIAKGPLTLNRFTDFAEQALEGLLATHRGGLLHLDLKPSNIMFSEEGGGREHVKIIDYGRARILSDAEDEEPPRGEGLQGSIFYSSPEHLQQEELDERADLYSLGSVFYWALSGKRPFDGGTPLQVMAAHLQHQVTDLGEVVPELPQQLVTWVMSLIQYDRNDRPRNAAEALAALTHEEINMIELSQVRA